MLGSFSQPPSAWALVSPGWQPRTVATAVSSTLAVADKFSVALFAAVHPSFSPSSLVVVVVSAGYAVLVATARQAYFPRRQRILLA